MGISWKGIWLITSSILATHESDSIMLQFYESLGEKLLARQAFDRARSIDPSLALPWAGMSVGYQDR